MIRLLAIASLAAMSCSRPARDVVLEVRALPCAVHIGGAELYVPPPCHLRRSVAMSIVAEPSMERATIRHMRRIGAAAQQFTIAGSEDAWTIYLGAPGNERTGGQRKALRCSRRGGEMRCR